VKTLPSSDLATFEKMAIAADAIAGDVTQLRHAQIMLMYS
jgi:hypothetical protein